MSKISTSDRVQASELGSAPEPAPQIKNFGGLLSALVFPFLFVLAIVLAIVIWA
ncbi:hypothetical protein Caka_2008 [Coraliomargarita akajimensis DSM 45221]|uniref:Uncharacterized protein n=1 Tax=Coraliomargarita akajimensis (strain DSM 45221 / IAM 15411 / JCM 23193 / KCTC 12865 / 04OKA010-24) TaxID=583355 RepID=D5EKW9_CORAD|nr:hypothetical protein Caka_2008 [Coraliomargarita akajimensis DSM 45221]